MKKKLSKVLAVCLSVAVLFATVIPESVYATQIQTGDTEKQTEGITDAESVSANDTVSENEIEAFGEEGKLNYLYLGSNYIEAPGSEQILVSFGNEETVISNATLTVENYESKEKSYFYSEETMDNTVLFTMDYTAKDQGIYEAVSVSVTTVDGKTKRVTFSKTGMDNVYFGVNQEVVLSEEEPLLTDETVEMQIITFDEGNAADVNSEEISDAVEGALDEAETNIEDETWSVAAPLSAISTLNLGTVAIPAEKASQGNLVVVLDPGHDATHAGARANGLKEEELTLKIAKYCKEELEKYAGVTVYMTRSSSTCPFPGTSSTDDNANRVAYAQSVGADVFVSIHLNSASSSSASGAEVFYPNSNYNSAIGSAGANLSAQISRQLATLGLSNRGITIRNSADGTKYPDGSLADYYGVIRRSKLAGFPAVIVEHAFLTNASDAAFLSQESNLKKLGVADATGIANYYGLSSQAIQFTSQPIKVSSVDNINGTISVNITGVTPLQSVASVRFAVWSSVNGKDDLQWYVAESNGNGTFSKTINVINHKYNEGTYNIHAYAFQSNGRNQYLSGTTTNISFPSVSVGAVQSYLSADGTMQVVNISDVKNAKKIQVAVWSDVGGKDDLVWYNARNMGGNTWTVWVPIKNHKGSVGQYNVHVYGANASDVLKYQSYTTFKVCGPTVAKPEIWGINSTYGNFRVCIPAINSNTSIKSVKAAVWSNSKNLYWYTAKPQNDGTYMIDVDLGRHDYEYGVYNVHIYAEDENGLTGFNYVTCNVTQPESVITAMENPMQSVYSIKASNIAYAGGVKGVKVAVWSDVGGKDDLVWYDASMGEDGSWNTNVKISNHKSAGSYSAHVYLYDRKGKSHYAGYTSFSVDEPTVAKPVVVNEDNVAGTFKISIPNISAKSGVSSVKVAVWSNSNNKKWYSAKRQNDGSYTVDVNLKDHKYSYGVYNVHAYVVDGNGVSGFNYTICDMEQPIAAVLAIGNSQQSVFTLKASGVGYAGGVKGVRFAVWSDVGGKDDLIWYNATPYGQGVWNASVSINNHRTAGNYSVHMYIVDSQGGAHYGGYTSFSVEGPSLGNIAIQNVNESNGTFEINITSVASKSGIKEIRVATWCTTNKSDIVWYNATPVSGGYKVYVDARNHHNNTGTYNAHVYATDNKGITSFCGAVTCKIINISYALYPITGSTSVSVEQLMAYYNSVSNYPSYYATSDAPNLKTFCQMYIDECNAEGIKAEVAFAQAMKETNFLRYTGDVGIDQFNFAGMGATGNGVKGERYQTVRLGIRAQVQHLKGYANSSPLNQTCVDSRFGYIRRGCAPYVEWLGQHENPIGLGWATAFGYGNDIVKRIAIIKNM